MEKHKWFWKRKSFNSSPCGSESSDSASSPSEKDSCIQEALKRPSSGSDLSAEFASEAPGQDNEVNDEDVVNVIAKEDLVKQPQK